MITTYVIALSGSLVLLGTMLELLRRKQLREKYAALWLLVSAGVLVLGVAPGLLNVVADGLGVADPPNLLLFITVVVLLLVCVHLSWELSRLEEETRSLAEEFALLRLQVESTPPRGPDGSGLTGPP